ncbi:hypothetical protein Bca4012_064795 [Brassica carinata]
MNKTNDVLLNKEDQQTGFPRARFRFTGSPLRSQPRGLTTTTTSSISSSSSGSLTRHPPVIGRSGSVRGGSSTQSGSSSGNQTRSDSVTSNSTSSATSPAIPTGNICPSGKIQLTRMTQSRSRSDVLGSGTGTYGHGSIMRGGGGSSGVSPAKPFAPVTSRSGETVWKKAVLGSDAEEVKRVGNEMYRKGSFGEALKLYDRAIALSPANAA